MEKLLIAGLAGAAVAAFAVSAITGLAQLKADVPQEDRAHLDPLPRGLRLLWPGLRILDYHVCQRLPKRLVAGPAEKLRLSGLLYLMSPTQFIALCMFGSLGFVSLAYLSFLAAGIDNWSLLLPVAVFGFVYPRSMLSKALKRRQKAIVRALPVYLDFLTMGVEAGLNMAGAISQAVAKGPAGPLRNEFGHVLRDLRAGVTRAEALQRMDARVRVPQITSFVSAVNQAERMGAKLGDTFRIQAQQRRSERFMAAEKAAMEAPVKLIFPLIVFIFPVTFVVLMFPIAMKFLQSGIF